MPVRHDIRNIAIVAHVDHGKTTLVDRLLQQSGTLRANQRMEERAMDSNELERERGITILAKNTAIVWKGTHINIVDTPGHADFGGEVERVLGMVDSVLLLVDACEGPMPQTRFVLRKSLERGLRPIVVVNKIDRPGARPHEAVDEVFDLFLELRANDEQLDFPVVYASAKDGYAVLDPDEPRKDMTPLLETLVARVPPPAGDVDGPFQFQVATLDYDRYLGRLVIGRIQRGRVRLNDALVLLRHSGEAVPFKALRLLGSIGLSRVDLEEASAGDIVSLAGLEDVNVGETICDPARPEPLPSTAIDEPTLSMLFMPNNSPFAGREGKWVTSRNLRERLAREILSNVSLRVEETGSPDVFKVSGRGVLHLSILIETMRREGYELQVSRPEVITKTENGVLLEPIEEVVVEVPEESSGAVIEKLNARRGRMMNLEKEAEARVRLFYEVPSRGLIGLRTEFLTDTRGEGVIYSVFKAYEPWKGDIAQRTYGVQICDRQGETVIYGLFGLQERGPLFIGAGVPVYEGQVIGIHTKGSDLNVNPTRTKKLTNMRASGSDEALRLTTPREMTLENAIEFVAEDELVEVTPKSVRLRKKVLTESERKRARG